jgi:hypothetical protein
VTRSIRVGPRRISQQPWLTASPVPSCPFLACPVNPSQPPPQKSPASHRIASSLLPYYCFRPFSHSSRITGLTTTSYSFQEQYQGTNDLHLCRSVLRDVCRGPLTPNRCESDPGASPRRISPFVRGIRVKTCGRPSSALVVIGEFPVLQLLTSVALRCGVGSAPYHIIRSRLTGLSRTAQFGHFFSCEPDTCQPSTLTLQTLRIKVLSLSITAQWHPLVTSLPSSTL